MSGKPAGRRVSYQNSFIDQNFDIVLDLQIWEKSDQKITLDFGDKLSGGINTPRIIGMSPAEAEEFAEKLIEAARIARERGMKEDDNGD